MGLQRRSWSPDEDKKLTELVQRYGPETNKWKFIKETGNFSRTPDSCRKRWKNHLNPTIKKGELSADEKHTIMRLQALEPNKWSFMAKQLLGRTPDQIKVCCNSRERDAHPPAPLEGTSSAGIIPQATSMLPSNQQTGESCHFIEGLLNQQTEESPLTRKQLMRLLQIEQSFREEFSPQVGGGITSHQRQQQHPQGPSASMQPLHHPVDGGGARAAPRAPGAASPSS